MTTRLFLAAAMTASVAFASSPRRTSPISQSYRISAPPIAVLPSGTVFEDQSGLFSSSSPSLNRGQFQSDASFTFAGVPQTDGDPPPVPTCPGNTLVGQNPDSPTAFTAYVSERDANFRRYENISAVAGPVTGVRWFGLELHYLGNGQWSGCTEPDPTFVISFNQSTGGIPGAIVCTYTLLAERIATGITYGGFGLNEYRVTLPTSCVLTNGWLAIQGQGDSDCWFLWMSGQSGDQHSYCQGCASSSQDDDLAFCLLGTPGGVFGACCNESTGSCTNNVEINQCALTGYRFTPNTTCANLDPPCQVLTGACCYHSTNTCAILTYADCNSTGGNWIGGNSQCSECPVLGACCWGYKSCTFETQFDCISENGTWLGSNTVCSSCPAPPACPKGSLFGQDPNHPDSFVAGTSEESANLRRFEYFSGVAGPVQSLTWWGVDLEPAGANQWIECAESDPTFIINFHKDGNGVPGDVVCSYQLLATRIPMGVTYLGTELNQYEVTLPTPCTMVRGWISIIGLGNPDCWFLWMSANLNGDSYCDHCNPPPQGFDLAVCLQGTYGGAVGACCNEATSQCADNVNMSNCIADNQRFEANTTCAQLNPPCGVILGACCYPDTRCSVVVQSECGPGGTWLGPNSICSSCPCITPCPPGGIAEGEVTCYENYDDEFNGGCIVKSPNFTPLGINQTVCGRSGVFLIKGEVHGDFDWYEVVLNHPTTLFWSVRAEFRTRAYIYNGSNGCPGNLIAFAAATECFSYSINANVQPGRYWCIIGPLAFDDAAQCGGARYYVKATINPPCVADVAGGPGGGGDDTVNANDLLFIINNWGPCGEPCPADISGGGAVNANDLLLVINNWGPCH